MVGLGGKASFDNPTSKRLKMAICRYRLAHPEMSCNAIARHFGVSRQLAHKILRAAGMSATARKIATKGSAAARRRFTKFVEKVPRGQGSEKFRIAAELGIRYQTLWRYELPPDDPRHRDMPEEMQERYRKLVEERSR